jgi:hypothetical protein
LLSLITDQDIPRHLSSIRKDLWCEKLSECNMTRYAHHHVVGPKITGYISYRRLEEFLDKRFPADQYPGAATNRFEIDVSKSAQHGFW